MTNSSYGISRYRIAAAMLVAFISFALTLGVAPMQAYADDTTGNTLPVGMSYSTDVERGPDPSASDENKFQLPDGTWVPNGGTDSTNYVRQANSGTARNFAAGLPLANIYINEKFENKPQVDIYNSCIKSDTGMNGTYYYYYDTTMPGAQTINGQQINTLSGDLISFTYKDAAILPDGSDANVKVMVSNAKLLLDRGITDTYSGYINLLVTPPSGDDINLVKLCPFTSGTSDVKDVGPTRTGKYADAGLVVDINYQIVDDDDKPIAGTFFYANRNLRFPKYNTLQPGRSYRADPIAYAFQPGFDSQGINFDYFADSQIINKSYMASDYVYVKSNDSVDPADSNRINYYPKITEDNGKIRFTAQEYSQSGAFQYSGFQYASGFVTLAKGGE